MLRAKHIFPEIEKQSMKFSASFGIFVKFNRRLLALPLHDLVSVSFILIVNNRQRTFPIQQAFNLWSSVVNFVNKY